MPSPASRPNFGVENKVSPTRIGVGIVGVGWMGETSIVARWTGWAGEGTENCRIAMNETGMRVDSAVIAPPEESFATRYALTCGPGWQLRRADVSVVGEPFRVVLVADGEGNWTDGEGEALPALSGAIDIDIAVTPFTNTLPIRRLGLGIGEEAVIDVAYIEPPTLSVAKRPQLYRRLGRDLYRFESLDHDFTAEIEIDGDGLVLTYLGLFRRIA